MTVLVLSLSLSVLVVTGKKTGGGSGSQNVSTEASAFGGVMGLSPATGDYVFSNTQNYPAGVVIDSGGKSIDGIDVVVDFDPKKVQVVGSEVSPSAMFERFPLNSVDNVKGQIRFSALTFSPKPEAGIAATFRFKPLSPGTVSFNFEFSLGKTTDSNMAEHGSAQDILGKVENGTYNFR